MATKPKKPKGGRGTVEGAAQVTGPPAIAGTKKPIGVPNDYKSPTGLAYLPGQPDQPLNAGFGYITQEGINAVHQLHGTSNAWDKGIAPRYYAGDESKILASYQGDQMGKLQTMLIQAGLLNPNSKSYVPGSAGPETIAAFKKLLSMSNGSGLTWQAALGDRLHAAQAAPPAETAARPPLQVQLTNPQDLEAVLQNSAKTLYGGNLPQSAVAAFVQQFQSQEAASQQANYNTTGFTSQGVPGGGGTFTQAPNPTVASQNFIKTTFPADYAAAGVGERFNQWTNLLNSTMSGGEGQAQH